MEVAMDRLDGRAGFGRQRREDVADRARECPELAAVAPGPGRLIASSNVAERRRPPARGRPRGGVGDRLRDDVGRQWRARRGGRRRAAQRAADPRIAVRRARAVVVLEVRLEPGDAPVPAVPGVGQEGVGEGDRRLAAVRRDATKGSRTGAGRRRSRRREMGEQRRGALLRRARAAAATSRRPRRRRRPTRSSGRRRSPVQRGREAAGRRPAAEAEAAAQLAVAGERVDQRRRQPVAGARPAPPPIRLDERDEHEPIGVIGGDRHRRVDAPSPPAGQLARVESRRPASGIGDVARFGGRRRPAASRRRSSARSDGLTSRRGRLAAYDAYRRSPSLPWLNRPDRHLRGA